MLIRFPLLQVNVAYTFTPPQTVNIEIRRNITVFLRADFYQWLIHLHHRRLWILKLGVISLYSSERIFTNGLYIYITADCEYWN